MIIGRRRDDHDRPAAGRIESRWKTEDSASGLRTRIAALGRDVLEIFRDRELDLDHRPRLDFFAGDGRPRDVAAARQASKNGRIFFTAY